MGKLCFLWPSFIHVLFFFFFFLCATDTVYGQYCREDQSSALLHLQQTLKFHPLQSSKLISWNNWSTATDCCSWRGVTCNKNGSIIGLDLEAEGIYGGLENSSSLFDLHHLKNLSLAGNSFSAPIPTSIGRLVNLEELDLSFSGFIGQVPLEISHMTKLFALDLSYNSLSFSPSTRLPLSISFLRLASCNITVFPNLRNHKTVYELDVSNNRIQGEIPNWVWNVENLNLSHNLLSHFEMPFLHPNLNSIWSIDLHSNMLTGPIRLPFSSRFYIDYSYNNFSSIPADIGDHFPFTAFFTLSHNELVGGVPMSICNFSDLLVLDLSYNRLDGEIPSCIFNKIFDLRVLNLSGNKLKGYIPEFSSGCVLQTLDLNNNLFEGQVPSSLMNCTGLKVLNLGRNQISDKFPCWLTSFSNLRILVLRSNKLHGPIINCLKATNMWKSLQILDLAHNNFSGDLPFEYVSSWKAMLTNSFSSDHLKFDMFSMSDSYYVDKVEVVSKGQEVELVKILNIFTSIDLSSNMFRGVIPSEIGRLTALHILNISNNALTGKIPSSVGNMKNLESLDLSHNKLTGYIPKELGELTFLSYLNLSFNELEGAIPSGTQFQTFSEESFKGNRDLCGFPSSVSCRRDGEFSVLGSSDDSGVKIKWGLVLNNYKDGFGENRGTIEDPHAEVA